MSRFFASRFSTSHFSTSRFSLGLSLLLLLALLAGCGGGGSGGGSSSDSSLPSLSSPILVQDGHQQGETYWARASASGSETGGLGCGDMDESYHIHSQLSIFLNGRQLAVPAGIGIKNPTFQTKTEWPDGFAIYGDCHYSIHTHDTSGKIHVEAPEPGRFTLGQTFAIWNQPLTRSNIAGITGFPVEVLIKDGGNYRRYTGELGDIELISHREITIIIGTPPARVPTVLWLAA